jgi:hypothetical protein
VQKCIDSIRIENMRRPIVVGTTWARPDVVGVLGIEFAEVSRAGHSKQASNKRASCSIFRNSCTPSAEDSDSSCGLLVLPLYVPTYLRDALSYALSLYPIVHLLTLPIFKQALDARLDHA